MDKNQLYRRIPKVDILLEKEEIKELITRYGRESVMEAVREETEALRAFIGKCRDEEAALEKTEQLPGPSGNGWSVCIHRICGL